MTASAGAGSGGISRHGVVVACACLALAVWMLSHSYLGIIHDNRIYALLAMNHDDPSLFARDLFLTHGSQDSYTVFSPLYAWFIRLLGLDTGTRLLVAAGQALWVLGALALIRRIVAPRFAWLALLFLAAYPPFYGGNSIFGLAEGFLSPRLYAEALGLAAIAAFLAGRTFLAMLLLVAGAALHPLMIAAPAGVILTMALTQARAWWAPVAFVAACSAVLMLALAIVHLAGLPMLPAIDAQWKFIVEHRTPQFMLANWDVRDWLLIAGDAIILLLACRHASPRLRQLLLAALSIGFASLAVSAVGFELLDDLMTGKLQIWRALWLVHVLAPVALALLVQDIAGRELADKRLLLVLAFAAVAVATICSAGFLPPFGVSILLLFAVVYLSATRPGGAGGMRPRERALTWISLAAIVAAVAMYAYHVAPSGSLAAVLSLGSKFSRHVVSGLAVLLAGVLLFSRHATRTGLLLAIAAAAALAGALFHWDQRGDWRRYMDSAPDIAGELKTPIRPGELVYWPTDVMALWGALRNPSYYSDVQGAGVIFNRGTAIEYLQRLQRVAPFEPALPERERLLGRPDSHILRGTEADLTLADLVRLCTGPDHPDVVVLGQNIAGASHETWQPRVPYRRVFYKSSSEQPNTEDIGMKTIDTYFVYRCRDIGQVQLGRPGGRAIGAARGENS